MKLFFAILLAILPRVIVSTDIGGTDPDDNQSMTHLLMNTDRFELEGLISSPSFGDGRKEEILRMIDVYEQDYPVLKQHAPLMPPETLRSLVKQGRMSEAPVCGYGEPTEGSEWIIQQARKKDNRPLYICVWGCLEDVAQALHDAPDIVDKIRVYWIGGPNKKWGVNAYCYIAEHFPNLWLIENNSTYRGFIYDSKDKGAYDCGYFDSVIANAGHLGRDFGAYYKGNPKMGDTPSLLYVMNDAWGGQFVPCTRTPRRIINQKSQITNHKLPIDTVPVHAILEWHLTAPSTLHIRKQDWHSYDAGNGEHILRHATYYTGTLDYTITSDNGDIAPISGQLEVLNTWDVAPCETDYIVGPNWFTDSYAPADYWHGLAGARTQREVRKAILDDWTERWNWLK